MINTSLPSVASMPTRLAPTNLPAAATAAVAEEEPKDITIGQALEGFAGAVVTAGIETVGNTASSLIRAPQAAGAAYKALWNTELLGPVLKTALGVMLVPCTVAAPLLTAIGSLGFGLFRGFDEGMHHGVGAAIEKAGQDVKTFHKDLSGKLVEGIHQFETAKLPEGKEPYEIKVIEAGKGLVAGTVGAAIDGAGVGLITLGRTPRGVVRAFSEIWNSDQGPVLKTCESLLVLPAALLAAPLGLVGGAVYGLVTGFKDGYQKGLGEAIQNSAEIVSKYNKLTREALDKD